MEEALSEDELALLSQPGSGADNTAGGAGKRKAKEEAGGDGKPKAKKARKPRSDKQGAEAGTAAATATGDDNEMGDEAAAAHEKSEETAAPKKKTKRSKRATLAHVREARPRGRQRGR